MLGSWKLVEEGRGGPQGMLSPPSEIVVLLASPPHTAGGREGASICTEQKLCLIPTGADNVGTFGCRLPS
jgi:hypothetical protein